MRKYPYRMSINSHVCEIAKWVIVLTVYPKSSCLQGCQWVIVLAGYQLVFLFAK
jgi:hypothetical protein